MENVNDPNWMVLYTRSKWEKKVDKLLKDQNITSYCPLVKTNKKWVDRTKVMDIPLFSSYLFVHARHRDLDTIVQTAGVVTYITFCGKPAIIRDQEIDNIRNIVSKYHDIETVSLTNLSIGDDAIITNGPFATHQGAVQQINGKSVLLVLKTMNCALTVKIDSKILSPVTNLI